MRTRRCLTSLLPVILLACGGGASGIATAYDASPDADFSSYSTYVWVESEGGTADAQADTMLREAIDAELAAKGLSRVSSGDADAGIGYQVALSTSTTQEMVGRGWRGGYSSRSVTGYTGGGTGAMQRDVEHTAGTLFILLFDGDSKEAVWTGVGNGAVNPDLDADARRERINSVVGEIMAGYPPR